MTGGDGPGDRLGDGAGYGNRGLCSAVTPGWSSLLVYRVDNDPVAEAVTFGAFPEQVVVVVDAGRKTIEARGDGGRWHRSRYEPGQVAMTAPGQPTRLRWRGLDRVQTIHVHLPGALIDTVALQVWGRDATALRRPDALSTVDPVLAALARGLCEAARLGVDDLYAELAAQLMTVHLLVHHAAAHAPRPPRPETRRVERVTAYLREHQSRPISLAEMAGVIHLSPYHFLRVFKAATGKPPHRYLQQLRVDTACRYVTRTDLQITEIAALCGFGSPSRLAAEVRRATGSSPSALRIRHGASGSAGTATSG